MVRESIFSKFCGNAPAGESDIKQFEVNIGIALPTSYVAFMQKFNGGEGFIGENAYVIFWKLEEIAEMNKAYQVEEYAPGFLIFGSDGGGEAYAFDTRAPKMRIVSIPFVGMDPSLSRVMASNFDELLEVLYDM